MNLVASPESRQPAPALRGRSVYIGLACALILASGYLGLWEPLGLSGPAAIAWVTLLAAALLWMTEAIPLHATGLVILLVNLAWLLPSLEAQGRDASQQAFLAPFFSDVILLFLGGFVLSAALNAQGLDERLARALLQRTSHSLHLSVFVIMTASAFLSMWLSNTATAAMMLALCTPIAAQLEPNPAKVLLLSVPVGANVGGLGTPIGTPPNAIALEYLQQEGRGIGFGQWMAMGVPGVLALLGAGYLLLRMIFPYQDRPLPFATIEAGMPSSTEPSASSESTHEPGAGGDPSGQATGKKKLDPRSWLTIQVTLFTVAGWVTSSLHGLSPGTVALFAVVALTASGVVALDDFRGLPWDVLMLMGGGLTLGVAIQSSGLADWIVGLIPTDGGQMTLFVAFAVIGCTMSTLMSNTATANLLMPVIVGLASASASALLVVTAFACSLAMALPVSTPPNAIAFASGKLESRDLLRPGILMTLLGVGLVLTAGIWWWKLLGAV